METIRTEDGTVRGGGASRSTSVEVQDQEDVSGASNEDFLTGGFRGSIFCEECISPATFHVSEVMVK